MATTVAEVASFRGQRFTATLDKYVNDSGPTTYYVVNGTRTDGATGHAAEFRFIVEPETTLDANSARWVEAYAAMLDTIFGGGASSLSDGTPLRKGI